MNRILRSALLCACALGASAGPALGQAEVMAWGSIDGIRVEGQRMPFESDLCAIAPDGHEVARTAKERQLPHFSRQGDRRTVTSRLGSLSFTEVVDDTGPGAATVDVRFAADSVATDTGGYLCLYLPRSGYGGGTVQLTGAASGRTARAPLGAAPAGKGGEYLRGVGRGVSFASARDRLVVSFPAPTQVVVRPDDRPGRYGVQVLVPILTGHSAKGRAAEVRFGLAASGEIDHGPVVLALDAAHPGRAFDGLGGNFRIQNPAVDTAVVDYNLENLRVAWGRVEFPWRSWQPEEHSDPAASDTADLDPRVRQAMEMARKLAARRIPVIVSCWFPPDWAVTGGEQPEGARGRPLNPEKMEEIYASITSYLLYLKRYYGVEAALFSFNESDLGIDVRQTPEEHLAFIKGLGAYLAAHGLSTKMLLGDTSDATPTAFIAPALADASALPYIGAVSFHSWRGWSDDLLSFWGSAARKLNVPLLVGEGSTDAGAWRYPEIFQEPSFALQEIDLYTRILAIAEPESILQWQLTGDYSVLAGGGVFGDTTALRPTQRFWNLKQLASTPAGAFALPIRCGDANLSCAAFGEIARGEYAVHVVNRGAARPATLTGLPAGIDELRAFVTDGSRGMEELPRIPVSGGTAKLTLRPTSFTTLIGAR
ncbi:MAG TPA: hypothetical protein VFL93_02705 [Longimicrobiaceae bacterium]|nr:hypothetical protein [Longimicrobiaceae bacterium]